MKSIYGLAAELLSSGNPFALATLVRSRGSTPQVAGSQAIFFPDGRSDGNLGGGCLEMEARRRALSLLAKGGGAELLTLHLDSDYGFDDGLICGGTAEILIEVMSRRSLEVFRLAAQAVEQRQDAGVALLFASPEPERIAPRAAVVAGGPALVDPDAGNAGEMLLQQAAAAARREISQPSVVGEIFVEPLHRSPTLLIVGAGHVGAALAAAASRLEFHVIVLDDRPSFADARRLASANQVLLGDIPSTLRELWLPDDASVVIVTRGHRHDGSALRECLGRPLRYLGMIGSRRKIKLIYDEILAEQRASLEELSRVRAPLGLDIGAETVEEIAVSIAAELILVRRSGERPRTGHPLHEGMREILKTQLSISARTGKTQ